MMAQKKYWSKFLVLTCLALIFGSGVVSCSSEPKEEERPKPVAKSPRKAKKTEDLSLDDTPKASAAPTAVAETKKVDPVGSLDDLKKKKQWDEVYKLAIETLGKEPQNEAGLQALTEYYLERRQLDAAYMMLRKWEKVNANSESYLLDLALTDWASEKNYLAIRGFKKVLDKNPRNLIAAENLGCIYVKNKDYSKAAFAFEGLGTNKAGMSIKGLNSYAIALTAAKKNNEAQAVYKQILAKEESNKTVLFNYAYFLIERANDPNQGLEIINKLNYLGPSPEVKDSLNALENKAKSGLNR